MRSLTFSKIDKSQICNGIVFGNEYFEPTDEEIKNYLKSLGYEPIQTKVWYMERRWLFNGYWRWACVVQEK